MPVNPHFPLIDIKPFQPTPFHQGLPGGERGAVRINKTATVTGDPRRVGNNHLGFMPGHFNPAIEVTAVMAVDFVEDNAGVPFG